MSSKYISKDTKEYIEEVKKKYKVLSRKELRDLFERKNNGFFYWTTIGDFRQTLTTFTTRQYDTGNIFRNQCTAESYKRDSAVLL